MNTGGGAVNLVHGLRDSKSKGESKTEEFRTLHKKGGPFTEHHMVCASGLQQKELKKVLFAHPFLRFSSSADWREAKKFSPMFDTLKMDRLWIASFGQPTQHSSVSGGELEKSLFILVTSIARPVKACCFSPPPPSPGSIRVPVPRRRRRRRPHRLLKVRDVPIMTVDTGSASAQKMKLLTLEEAQLARQKQQRTAIKT